jgi:hypothetical protein
MEGGRGKMQVSGMTAYEAYKRKSESKWGKSPKIQEKAQATVDRVVTDRLKDRIAAMAQEDAKKDVYMDSEFVQMCQSYMHKYVSPDISQPLAQTNAMMQALKEKSPELEFLDAMLDNCSVKGSVTSETQNAEIYSADGEMLASYNSLGGGWTIEQTAAERKFLSETTALYSQAFSAARKAIKEAQTTAQADPSDGSTVNVLA